MPAALLLLFQQLRATQPTYFFLVTLVLLIAGGIGWLIASVLGFARSPAFGPSATAAVLSMQSTAKLINILRLDITYLVQKGLAGALPAERYVCQFAKSGSVRSSIRLKAAHSLSGTPLVSIAS